jgi:TonB-dependent starch-binding outer membrane protein SusC
LLKSKLEATLDIYNRTTSGMLTQEPIPRSTSIGNIAYSNIGEINNKGVDLTLNWRNKIGKLRYTIGAMISKYKNNVVKINENPNTTVFGFSSRLPAINVTKAGLPMASYYGYIVDGVIKDAAEAAAAPKYGTYTREGVFKYKDINGDNIITAADKTIIGNPHPDFTYGFNINLGYKNWNFSLFAQGTRGNEIFNYLKYWTDFNTFQGNRSKDMLYKSWKKPGDIAQLPRLNSLDGISSQSSSYFIEDGSYMRFKNIQLTYSLPTVWLQKVKLVKAQVYVQGQNLLTITKYSGLDPDISMGLLGQEPLGLHQGVDAGFVPAAKVLNMGLSLGF